MHLGICADRLAGWQTGVARYLSNLLEQWERAPHPFERVTLFSPTPLEVSPRYAQAIGGGNWPAFLWEHVWVAREARRLGIDLLFGPGYILPLAYRGPGVVTIHDVMQEALPDEFPWSSRFRRAPLYRRSARRATAVLTLAEIGKRDIQHYYGVPPQRIHVVPLAADPKFCAEPDPDAQRLRDVYGLGSDPVILFVGKLSRRRNVPALIEAFGRLVQQNGTPHRLVLAGPNHLELPIEHIVRECGVSDRVVHGRYIPDADLVRLYRLAESFVYPSEMEGFGLPLLEAMASGTPVITLRRPVLVEVAGDAAWYAEEGRPAELHAALVALAENPARREELSRRGLERAREFSWERTARRTMEVLAAAAGALSPTVAAE